MNVKPITLLSCLYLILLLAACRNHDINEGEQFRPRQVDDSYDNSHFTLVTIDGVEYLMTERDNNNPHEGFGFMAFRANKLIEKADTTLAYLRTVNEFQIRIYAKLYNISMEEAREINQEAFLQYLSKEGELVELEKKLLRTSHSMTAPFEDSE